MAIIKASEIQVLREKVQQPALEILEKRINAALKDPRADLQRGIYVNICGASPAVVNEIHAKIIAAGYWCEYISDQRDGDCIHIWLR